MVTTTTRHGLPPCTKCGGYLLLEHGEGRCINCGHALELAALSAASSSSPVADGDSRPRPGNALAGGPPELPETTTQSETSERTSARELARAKRPASADKDEYSPNTRLYGVGYRLLGLTVPEIVTLLDREHGRCRTGELDCSCLHTVVAVLSGDNRLAECRYCSRLWRPAERVEGREFALAFDLNTEVV